MVITPETTDLHVSEPTSDYFISDHTFVGFTLNIPKPPRQKVPTQFRRIAKINLENFRDDLQLASGDLMKLSGENLAKQYDLKLEYILNKHAPVISKMVLQRTKVAWFTAETRKLRTIV